MKKWGWITFQKFRKTPVFEKDQHVKPRESATVRQPPDMSHFPRIGSQIKNPKTILEIRKYTAFLEVLLKPLI